MTDSNTKFHLVDTKVGNRAEFDTAEAARSALNEWIHLQRNAGEPVIQLATGQWQDSKLTIWISNPSKDIVRLES